MTAYTQLNLLDLPPLPEGKPLSSVPGLRYIPNFINPAVEKTLLEEIDQQPWITDLKRRVQHYGYRYDYKARAISPEAYLGTLPEWLKPLTNRLWQEGYIPDLPDQVIVNEYIPGQGITAHIDCIDCFSDTILSLSLGSDCIMRFTAPSHTTEDLVLERRSLVVLQRDARYQWQHSIPARKSDLIKGQKQARSRRISLTFRKVMV